MKQTDSLLTAARGERGGSGEKKRKGLVQKTCVDDSRTWIMVWGVGGELSKGGQWGKFGTAIIE